MEWTHLAELILRPPQIPMTDWLMHHKRCGLWAGMGIGKTIAVYEALDRLRILGEIDVRNPTLVVGPARVARDTWANEARKWDNFKDLRIVPLVGSPDQRLRRLRVPADIYTISYELAPWLVEYWLAKWPYRNVVADESDRLKSFREKAHASKRAGVGNSKSGSSGKRAFQLARVAHNLTDRWINLTGTPAPAGLKDLWGQTWYLDRGARLGATYGAFERRWFRKKWGSDYGIEPMPHSDAEIHSLVGDIYLTIDPNDYFDLRLPIYSRIDVELPAAAKRMYSQARKEMFIAVQEMMNLHGGISIMNAAALSMKCLQIAQGAVYTDSPKNTKWMEVHDRKLEALDSVVHEASGAPVLVGINLKSDRARILKMFPQAADIATPAGMERFKNGKATIGVAHPASMGHGIDGLQYIANILVFFGHNWKTGERLQFLERIGPMRQFQAGLERPVYVYDIVAKGTEDERIMRVHHENISVQDALLESANAFRRGE